MVEELLDGYARWLELSRSSHTKDAYLSSVRRFMSFVGKDIDRISELDLTNYLYDLKRRCSDRSVARHGYAIRSFLEFIGKSELASRIPIPSSWISCEPRWLEPEQVKLIIEHASSLRDKAILQTAYDLALRVSEVCLLNRDWLDIASKTMKVVRLKRKGQRQFMLPIQDETAELLE